MLLNLRRLMQEASDIKRRLDTLIPPLPQPVISIKLPKIIPQPKNIKLILTSLPNVINGIATDQDGNYLQSVIVVIKDKDGLPVRALKTNKLGQFTGATPLPQGLYTIELEKEGFFFDLLQIELTNNVLPPLAIVAKRPVGVS